MSNKTLKILVCLTVGFMPACAGMNGKTHQNANLALVPAPTATPLPIMAQEKEPQPNSPIRQIDFGNFTFPELPTKKCSMHKVRLVNGRYDAPERLKKLPSLDCWSVELALVIYGDVTADSEEEAIIELYAELGGNSSYSDVYIYTSRSKRPALLWKFMTGDRADGGLKRIYAQDGRLVIELYGIGTRVGQLESSEDVGDCCPKHYTRTKYRWNGKRFQQDGEKEVLPFSPSP